MAPGDGDSEAIWAGGQALHLAPTGFAKKSAKIFTELVYRAIATGQAPERPLAAVWKILYQDTIALRLERRRLWAFASNCEMTGRTEGCHFWIDLVPFSCPFLCAFSARFEVELRLLSAAHSNLFQSRFSVRFSSKTCDRFKCY